VHLTDEQDISDDADAGDQGSRLRFKGIVEANAREATQRFDEDLGVIRASEDRWNARSRQIWQAARMTAVFVFFSMIVGPPVGNWIAHQQLNHITGVVRPWNPLGAYSVETLMFAFTVPPLIIFIGYAISRLLEMLRAAESVAAAAQRFMTPDTTAAGNVDAVGAVVQAHVSALNEGLDSALTRLASVEAMIRQHVEAIEIAGDAIESKATSAVGRVADERSRLMDLTESLNAHADSFAAAIAEKARTTIASLESAENTSLQAEKEFEDRLARLEGAAQRAFDGFEALRDALRDVDESMRASAQSIDATAEETRRATERANAAAKEASDIATRNALAIGESAQRAAEEARRAADEAIDAAREHAERAASTAMEHAEKTANAAVETTREESLKVQDAASRALEEISKTTSGAVAAAQEGATMATRAAAEVSEAARRTGEAADKASSEVAAASERARKSADDALKFTESEASRIEERNKALAEARAALEEENARLESLIDEQRKRADRLAEAIASQTDRLSRLAEAQLREQEAAARLAEAQNEMQARADRQASERKKAEEAERRAREEETAKKAEAAAQSTLELGPAAQKPSTLPVTAEAAKAERNNGGAARLDELARDIAERRPAKGAGRKEPPIDLDKDAKKAGGKRMKGDVSWREILDAADDGAPLDLGAASKKEPPAKAKAEVDAENAIRIIAKLQDFTHEMETRLYGDPPPALQERFERGDRNVFANRLLRLNEADVKRRIRTESGRDRKFEHGVHEFLQGFEQLLEDATTSETADEELEEYLSSPLGRVYLLIGATVGYFA